MKTLSFTLALAMLISTSGCAAQPEKHNGDLGDKLESYMDVVDELMEDFGDSMDALGDWMTDLGEELAEMADSVDFSDGKPVVVHFGKKGSLTINGSSYDNRHIHIDKNDPMLTHKFRAESFDALEVNHGFRVVMCDTVDSIVVRYNAKLKNHLNVRYNKGKLHIGLNHIDGISSDNGAYCGYVHIPYNLKLNSVTLSGFSVFTTNLPMKTRTFSIELSGASKIKVPSIMANRIDCEMSGASKLESTLKAGIVDADLSGASAITADIKATKLDADLSGASTMSGAVAAESINADLSGASKMNLKGTIGKVYADISGASKLIIPNLIISNSLEGELSGASSATVHCKGKIKMEVSGTSGLFYSGNPETDISKSRTATVEKVNN